MRPAAGKKPFPKRRVRLSKRDADLLTEATMCDKIQSGPALCTHVWAGYLAAKAGIGRRELLAADFEIEYDGKGNATHLVLSGPGCRGC